MAIPQFEEFMRPVLAFCADGTEKNIQDVLANVPQIFNLTSEELEKLLPSGTETYVHHRTRWARTYLVKAGALISTKRGFVRITDRGRTLLNQHPMQINKKILMQFPEFVEFVTPKNTADTDINPSPDALPETALGATPEEQIDAAFNVIQRRLEVELLDRIGDKSPTFFEALVVDLIVKMGYGGSKESVVQRIGKVGDGGIDGIVNQDALGLDVVYVQAKRYEKDKTISREAVQSFAGALEGKRATKGIFVTTCSFSPQAKAYADSVHKKIILIDGKMLTNLMVHYGVGVRIEREFQVKRIDLDYFDEADT